MKNKLLLWGQTRIEKGAWYFAPLSLLFCAISAVRNAFYDRKLLPIHRVDCPVISIGNVVAGGTSKTPFVYQLSRVFNTRRVAILSRGYGKVADEAMWLKEKLPHVRVYIGADRVALAQKATLEGAELILLDDGFQHRRLFRDLDVVLLDGEDPWGKGHFLPWGYLRDSPRRASSADFVFTSGEDFEVRCVEVKDLKGNPVSLQGKKVSLFSGIAKPKKFRKTVEELGATAFSETILFDHEAISYEALLAMQKQGVEFLVCTEKDRIKLPPQAENFPVVIVEVSLFFLKEERWTSLIEKIETTLHTS